MTKKILAFGASSSKNSINKKLAQWAASEMVNVEIKQIDLNDYEMPIYSVDREQESGIPQHAHDFRKNIENSDGIIISFAEHNGAYSAAFKNVFDWASRIGKDIWHHKPMLLMATSPGGRGGKTVLDIAVNRFGFMGAGAISHFSLPSFMVNFDKEKGIIDESLRREFSKQLDLFQNNLK